MTAIASALKYVYSPRNIAGHPFAKSVHSAPKITSSHVFALAGLSKECECTPKILRQALSILIRRSQPHTSSQVITFARAPN